MLEKFLLFNATEIVFYPYDSKRVLDPVLSLEREDNAVKEMEKLLLKKVTSKYNKNERRFESVTDDNRPEMDNKVVFEVRLISGAVVYYSFYDTQFKVGLTLVGSR